MCLVCVFVCAFRVFGACICVCVSVFGVCVFACLCVCVCVHLAYLQCVCFRACVCFFERVFVCLCGVFPDAGTVEVRGDRTQFQAKISNCLCFRLSRF